MIKNKQHSFLAKKLRSLKEQVNYYLLSLKLAKSNLTTSWFNPFDENKVKYLSDIQEYRYMVNSISEEIRETKKRICKVQKIEK